MTRLEEIKKLIKDNNCEVVYFDLDGVLADFEKSHDVIMAGTPYEGVDTNRQSKYLTGLALEAKNYMWEEVNNHENFYGTLEVLSEGMEIFNEIKKEYNVKILSAVPKCIPEKAKAQKEEWCKRHLGDIEVIVVCRGPKCEKVDVTNSFLIDDREDNIEKWNKAGGIGYLYK